MYDYISLFLKYFPVSLGSIYVFKKLLNINVNNKYQKWILLTSLILSTLIVLIRIYIPYISMFIIITILIILNRIIYNISLESTIIVTSISFGITYSLHIVSSFFTLPAYALLHGFISNVEIVNICSDIVCAIIQTLLCLLPFKFKRFNRGVLYLQKEKIDNVGVIIACLIPLATTFFDASPERDFYYFVPIIYICMLGTLIFFWFRIRLRKDYYQNLRNREIDILKHTIEEQNKVIENYKAHCDELAKIIHRDNKAIPAMDMAIENVIYEISQYDTSEITKQHLNNISERLKTLSTERKNIILDYEFKNQILPKTNLVSVDATINYMYKKAVANGINYDVVIVSTDNIVNSKVDETDLSTILADLVENAIIATINSDIKKVTVTLDFRNDSFNISIFDSGIDFHESTFECLGNRRNSTHKETGGSGIGLMTTMDICRKYHASFCIDEILPDNTYTKKVTICFDDLSQIRISTNRKNIIQVCSKRNDITLIHL